MTLRSKLYTLFGLTVAMTCGLTAYVQLHLAVESLHDELVENTETALFFLSRTLEERVRLEGPQSDAAVRQLVTDTLTHVPNIIDVEVEVDDISGPPHTLTLHLVDQASTLDVGMERSMVLSTSVNLGGRPATVRAHVDETIVKHLRERLIYTFVAITTGAVLLSLVLLSYGTETLVTLPLALLRRQVERVAGGRLDTQLNRLRGRSDEMGVLARSLHDMIEALAQAEHKNQQLISQMRESNRELDEHVNEATSQLQATNRELETAHAALLEASEQLGRQERLAALGQLAGTIAHELGTPLSTLSGHLELLLHGDLSDEHREAIAVAHQEATRMTETIRRFLSTTRGIQVTPEELVLEELVAQCVDLVLHPGERTRFDVDIHVAEGAMSPYTDRGLLRQVLINLITNARDAMGENGRLVVTAGRCASQLVLTVDDSGPGVPVLERDRIFEPFVTTKSPDRGTGLGLPICKEIARTLGGRLIVGDAPGKGARFTLRVPAFEESRERRTA